MAEAHRILVVDDDEQILRLTSVLLRNDGHEVMEAATGAECLAIVARDQPDLVLLDVGLPDMDGLEVCRRIKADPVLSGIFVVMVSGKYTSSAAQVEGLATGADGYLPRPLPKDELLARLNALLRIHRAEQALRNSETRFREIFDHMSSGVTIYECAGEDGEFRIRDINPASEAIGRIARDDVLGRSITAVLPEGKGVDALLGAMRRAHSTGKPEYLHDVQYGSGGSSNWAEHYVCRLPSGYIVVVHDDITERRRSEARLRKKQKSEAIGTLASGVAHEINNPINGIMNYAQLIHDRLPEGEDLKSLASEIIHETERVAGIVRNLRVFAQRNPMERSAESIPDILQAAVALSRGGMRGHHVAFEIDAPAELPQVYCNSIAIQQVLLNVLNNACESVIARYPDTQADRVVKVSASVVSTDGDRRVRTTVEDRGVGIDEDTRGMLFDPFFTTKSRAEHSGLGLAISRDIVQDHHGRLSVEIEPGVCTRFHVDLPVAE